MKVSFAETFPTSTILNDYLTPALNDDAIYEALLVGRHLIILNRSSQPHKTKFDGVTQQQNPCKHL